MGSPPSSPIISRDRTEVTVDARQYILGGGEPFHIILEQVAKLPDNGMLKLRTPFEPLPMMKQLENLGFAVVSERIAADDWLVSARRASVAG